MNLCQWSQLPLLLQVSEWYLNTELSQNLTSTFLNSTMNAIYSRTFWANCNTHKGGYSCRVTDLQLPNTLPLAHTARVKGLKERVVAANKPREPPIGQDAQNVTNVKSLLDKATVTLRRARHTELWTWLMQWKKTMVSVDIFFTFLCKGKVVVNLNK